MLVEHPDDETRGDGDQRREAERQVRAASHEGNDEDRGRGDNDQIGLALDPVEAHCANDGHDPDGEEREREFDHAYLPGRDRCRQRERKRQRRPEHARGAHLAPDTIERLKLDAGARLEPRRQPEDRHGDEPCGQEEAGQERARWRAAEERQGRNNDDPVDIGTKPRQRTILLAQKRGVEGRLGRVEAGRSAASSDGVEGNTALSHTGGSRHSLSLLTATRPDGQA